MVFELRSVISLFKLFLFCEMDQENQHVIYVDNWSDVCRLCLRNDQPLENMFVEQNFLENIQEVTSLVVSQHHFNMYICRLE